MRNEGHARHIGISFHGTADVLEKILHEHPEIEIVQLQINYLDWEDTNIQSRKCYEAAHKHGKRIIVMEPVKGGTLVNLPEEAVILFKEAHPQASLASWAIRYAAGFDGVYTVLSGMTTLEHVEDNTGYMQDFRALTGQEQQLLGKVTGIIRATSAIACTGCRYCTPDCPKNIAIPEYLGLYNNMKRLKNTAYMSNQTVYYGNLTQSHGKASDCILCGLCEKNCPQNLPIRDLLGRVAAEME
jgi:predicted aldo/keto reductase-like oxidoreductase